MEMFRCVNENTEIVCFQFPVLKLEQPELVQIHAFLSCPSENGCWSVTRSFMNIWDLTIIYLRIKIFGSLTCSEKANNVFFIALAFIMKWAKLFEVDL